MSDSNGHLDANLAALQERCRAFISWWNECPSQPGEYHLLSSLSGLPDLEIEHPGGRRIILYNRENPFETVREELADQSFPNGGLSFLFGLGLGYKALHILDAMDPGHVVYVVERNPDILRWALSLHDYSAEIRKRNIIFAVPEEEELRQFIQGQSGAILNGRIRLFLEKYIRLLDARTARLHDICHSQFNAALMNFNTVVQIGSTVIQNEVENLPKALLGWSPEGLMGGAFRNRPAIIVTTGPSLQKNISLLREAQGRALIIAVGQALRVLLAYDVRPDIICSIDFGESNYLTMSDAIHDADMPLLMLPHVYPRIPREYQGGLFLSLDSNSLLATAGADASSPLGNTMTVAHAALNLALAMGANPVIFTGQDLAYGESSHVEGAEDGRQVTIQGSRIIMKNKRVTKNQEVYWVPGYFGGRVPTISQLLAFRDNIEEMIRHHPDRRFINATEGGAHITGTEQMTLHDVLKTHCEQEFPIAEHLSAARRSIHADPRRLCRMLETSRNHLARLLQRVEKLERMTGEMKSLLAGDGGKGSRQQIHHLNSLNRQAMKSFSSLLESLDEDRLSQLATVRIKHLLIRKEEQTAGSGEIKDPAGQTINYCEELCAGLREVCPLLLEKIDRVRPVLDEYAALSAELKSSTPRRGEDAELHLRLGNCLRKMGHLRMAMEELEQATASESFRTAALEALFAVHMDCNRFELAGECLKRLPVESSKQDELQNLIDKKREQELGRLLDRAHFCLDRGDFVGCLLACRTLTTRHGDSPDIQRMLDQSLEMRERKIMDARQQVQRERERGALQDERDRHLQIARLRIKEKDYAAAFVLFRKLSESDPRDEESGMGSVLACEGLQNWEGAEMEIRRLMQYQPERGNLFRELGNILLHRGKSEEALENFRKVVDLDTGGYDHCLQIAAILSGAGKTADALPFYERHLKENPNDYRALVLWGDGFLRLGIGTAAKLSYETALRIRPGYGPAEERLKRLQPAATS